jgi:hypothetical protein
MSETVGGDGDRYATASSLEAMLRQPTRLRGGMWVFPAAVDRAIARAR